MPRKEQSNGRVNVGQAVSFPPEMLEAAKERAAALGLTLSAYIQQLVRKDLAHGGAVTIEERPGNPYTAPHAGAPHPGRSLASQNPLSNATDKTRSRRNKAASGA